MHRAHYITLAWIAGKYRQLYLPAMVAMHYHNGRRVESCAVQRVKQHTHAAISVGDGSLVFGSQEQKQIHTSNES